MNLKNILLLNLMLVLVSSCYYDNAEALYPNADINCDTVNVTFNPVASEIIYQSCATTNCHVAGTGRVLLTNYEEIKSTIDNGLFYGLVRMKKEGPRLTPGPKGEDCLQLTSRSISLQKHHPPRHDLIRRDATIEVHTRRHRLSGVAPPQPLHPMHAGGHRLTRVQRSHQTPTSVEHRQVHLGIPR